MNSAKWIFKNGVQAIDCTSFPYAFRTMWNTVRKATADKRPVDTKDLRIFGPLNSKGERKIYSFFEAKQLALEQGLLTADEQINSREFKRR